MKKLFILIILQQSPLDVESMRCMETLVGRTRGKGVKVQHMVNVEKVNEELDMKTMWNTEHNKAAKIFVVSSGKDIVACCCQILYLMQCFILGDMMERGKLSLDANTVLMWMNTHKSNAKYSKGFNPIR